MFYFDFYCLKDRSPCCDVHSATQTSRKTKSMEYRGASRCVIFSIMGGWMIKASEMNKMIRKSVTIMLVENDMKTGMDLFTL